MRRKLSAHLCFSFIFDGQVKLRGNISKGKKQTNKKTWLVCKRLDFPQRKRATKEKSVEKGDEVKEKPAATAGPCAPQRSLHVCVAASDSRFVFSPSSMPSSPPVIKAAFSASTPPFLIQCCRDPRHGSRERETPQQEAQVRGCQVEVPNEEIWQLGNTVLRLQFSRREERVCWCGVL